MTGKESIICANEACKKGLNGERKKFIPMRSHGKYCCTECRGEAWRTLKNAASEINKLKERIFKLEEREGKLIENVGLIVKEMKEINIKLSNHEQMFNNIMAAQKDKNDEFEAAIDKLIAATPEYYEID